jgi:hypothetical protein
MARIHDELDEVVEVLVMRKGLEYMGPNTGEPNNQHEWFFSVEVGEGGDGNLLHRGLDRRTESHLLLCGRIVDDRVPATTGLLPRTSQHVPPGNLVAFLHWGVPNDDERKGLAKRVRPSNLHHVLDSNHLLFFFAVCCPRSLLLIFVSSSTCSLSPVFDCCVRFCCFGDRHEKGWVSAWL